MSCSSVDLKAYVVGELAQRERAAADDHVRSCQTCREELERLSVTRTALMALEDEEAPQRIAFVSDRVFEPRWWQTMWRSGPVMGFSSAALLAVAILAHAFVRPPVVAGPPATVDTARIEQRIDREVSARIDAAVAKAVSATEARRSAEFARVLDAAEKRIEFQRRADLATLQQTVRYYDQQMGRLMVASSNSTDGRAAQ